MNKNVVVILFIVIVGGGIAALVAYGRQFTPKYKWEQELNKKSEEPYGLSLFYEVLDKQDQDLTPITKDIIEELDTTLTNTNFVSIANFLYLDSLEVDHLLKYAENGNNVFLAADGAPIEMLRRFFFESDTVANYDYSYDSTVTVNFEHKGLPFDESLGFHFQYLKDTSKTQWAGYKEAYFNKSFDKYGFDVFSRIRGNVVSCFYIQHGDGKIYFNATPLLFSNYYVVQKNGFKYLNNTLSTFNDGEIFWDETSLNSPYDNGGASAKNNPLQLLFSHYTLRWGWYLFLITVCLYLLFRSKREQRIIPLMPKNTNTTIAYTKAVGVLYFQKKEHKNIANEMYTIFLSDIRNRYYFDTNVEEKELIQRISDRSEIQKEDIENLFKQFRKIRFSPIANAKDLIKLHQTIEEYHNKRQ